MTPALRAGPRLIVVSGLPGPYGPGYRLARSSGPRTLRVPTGADVHDGRSDSAIHPAHTGAVLAHGHPRSGGPKLRMSGIPDRRHHPSCSCDPVFRYTPLHRSRACLRSIRGPEDRAKRRARPVRAGWASTPENRHRPAEGGRCQPSMIPRYAQDDRITLGLRSYPPQDCTSRVHSPCPGPGLWEFVPGCSPTRAPASPACHQIHRGS